MTNCPSQPVLDPRPRVPLEDHYCRKCGKHVWSSRHAWFWQHWCRAKRKRKVVA